MKKRPVCLIIRDGWGLGKKDDTNAIFKAKTPFTDAYEAANPGSIIATSGLSVGLPDGYQGNSEVGHLNIGSGRIIYQSLTRIDKSVSDGDFFTNPAFTGAIDLAKKRNAALHLMGLIQEEGVHAVTRHCVALLDLCKRRTFTNVLVHALTDGRDTPPKSAREHLALLQSGIDKTGTGRVATVMGRYYAMDRDKRWERTEIAYRGLMQGLGRAVASWQEAIDDAYASGETDEFIKPRTVNYAGIGNNDVVIFFNFRFDRTRQLTTAIMEPGFKEFATVPHRIHFVAMTHYYDNGHFTEAYPEIQNANILGEVLSNNGLRQLRCAETEKYAHVTFFFNGLRNEPFENEDRILVPSPKVATYDLKPEMSAFEVRDKLVAAIKTGAYDAVIMNFANCDMVGHTGVFGATMKAVETVDACAHDVVETALSQGGACILMADHGNAEYKKAPDGSPLTAHTTNPVPLTLIGAGNVKVRPEGKLCDIAPTILELLDIKKPAEMTGTSLIVH
ncbi:MAG TPA: 2,3-bisphosphoglycerate-independent phosphoglycerate mutase [Chitinivibrionales bacterium]|nr:2,3-bisphosphoglycerate-independent phosphoglycerate mutase [Chitinivibrionales bacterium]